VCLVALLAINAGPGALGPAAVAEAAPAAQQAPPPPSVSVSGEGIVTVQPDTARMVLGVDVFNASLARAESDSSQRMNQVIDALTNMGVAKDDIKTISFSVSPEYDYPQQGTPQLRGFRVSNLVSVKIRDVNRVGDLADAVIAVGATTIQGLSFELNDPSAAKDQARTQAMQDARHKAEQLAGAAGVTLGKPLSISESEQGGVPPVPLQPRLAAAPAEAAAPPPIQPGTAEVHVVVSVVYAIQ
jgi:uncharacterized protein YggE